MGNSRPGRAWRISRLPVVATITHWGGLEPQAAIAVTGSLQWHRQSYLDERRAEEAVTDRTHR
jgi:hypothetical protein